MKLLKNICRIILGLLFIYSGFVKGIDPLGSNYKFVEYFHAFHMGWMENSALFFSFFLSISEFILGISLLLNLFTKWAASCALLFMGILTPLTLILAIKNPVSDCGCFGDAMILTNWETFWKNLILLSMTLVIFYTKSTFKSIFNKLEQTVLLLGSTIFMLSISIHCYRHLPLIDFRPYAIGQNIQEGMTIPPDMPRDEYAITLKYKNKQTGDIQEFDEQNYPWQDTVNWEFVSSSEKLIKEGYKTPIRDFIIDHPEWGDITQEVLQDPGYTFLVIAYDIHRTASKFQDKLNQLAAYASEKGYRFYGLSASNPEDIQTYKEKHVVNYEFCSMDETQLKTIIRSNPGLILLREGTILNKWSGRDLPDISELKERDLTAYCINKQQSILENYLIWIFILGYAALLFFYLFQKHKKAYFRNSK